MIWACPKFFRITWYFVYVGFFVVYFCFVLLFLFFSQQHNVFFEYLGMKNKCYIINIIILV